MNKKKFFFEDPFAVADFVQKFYPEDCERTIKMADDILAQKFVFSLRWDMERTTEPVIFDGDIDWMHQPSDDPEWVYAFNRMRFWICLGQAYALTKDEKYAQCFAKQISHWIRTVRRKDIRCAEAWRSIEAGLRLEYWLKAIQYFEASPYVDDTLMALIYESVTDHAEFLMDIWDEFNLTSNWGVLSNHGLFMAGVMLPESSRTKEYIDTSIQRLSQEIEVQVYRDGVHWEQSPMYHNEVLSCYLDVALLAQRNNIPLPDNILCKTRDMCYFDLYSAKPDHHEICMGDSDDIDQRDILAKAAALFGDGPLKARSYMQPGLVAGQKAPCCSPMQPGLVAGQSAPCCSPMHPDFDSAWDLGEAGIDQYNTIAVTQPINTDKAFTDSGNFYFRSSWDDDATFLHFRCGALGSGHGHADKLHVDIFSRGEDVLVDAGRYTYVFGNRRIKFKELSAHNTLMVDGQGIYVCKDSWECSRLSRGINRGFFSDSRYGYTEGGHLAYIDCGVYVNRRVIYLKPDIVILADELYAKGDHIYNQFFHFNSTGLLEGSGDRYIYRGKRVNAQMVLLTNSVTGQISDCEMSRHYNQREKNHMVTSSFAGSGFVSAFTVFALSDISACNSLAVKKVPVRCASTDVIFTDTQAEALDIQFNDKHYTVVVAHEECGSPAYTFSADGCIGLGNCTVFDRTSNEGSTGTVLVW